MNKKIRVLHIDDEPDVLRDTKDMLESFRDTHFQVEIESNPGNAAPHALAFQPHVVLLDLYLPGTSGAQVAAALRTTAGLEQLPILLYTISGRMVTSDELKAWEGKAGKLDCFTKDATPTEIKNKLAEMAHSGGRWP